MSDASTATEMSPPEKAQPTVFLLLQGSEDDWGYEEMVFAACRQQGWRVIDLNLLPGSNLPNRYTPQGVLADLRPNSPDVLSLRELGCPVVRIGSDRYPEDNGLPAVLEDMEAAGRLAAEHFAERNFPRTAYVGYEPYAATNPLYRGMVARCAELGLECELLAMPQVQGQLAREDREPVRADEIGAWLGQIQKPIGVFTYSDRMALRICNACDAQGVRIPDDVAVLGHGNALRICECAPLRISSIQMAGSGMAAAAVQLLQNLMDGKPPPSAPLMIAPGLVVVRESTDVLAAADTVVAKAIKYLWQHLSENVGVDDVARAVSVSRRTLEVRFKSAVGRTVNAELRRRRLEKCCELLRDTEIPVAGIVPAVGFRSSAYLHAAFRRAYGITPHQYRIKNREV